jgi:hypothetical protein
LPPEQVVGQEIELNDQRAVIRGIVDANPSFTSGVLLFTQYSNALNYVPGTRNRMTFILARAAPGRNPAEVARQIEGATGLKARSQREFALDSIYYVAANTGIPINFGITVLLGFIVGVAIVGLTFSLFIRDNIKQFGALKAIGVTNGKIRGMVSLQAAWIGAIGYAIGIGFAAAFIVLGAEFDTFKGFYLPWQVLAESAWRAADGRSAPASCASPGARRPSRPRCSGERRARHLGAGVVKDFGTGETACGRSTASTSTSIRASSLPGRRVAGRARHADLDHRRHPLPSEGTSACFDTPIYDLKNGLVTFRLRISASSSSSTSDPHPDAAENASVRCRRGVNARGVAARATLSSSTSASCRTACPADVRRAAAARRHRRGLSTIPAYRLRRADARARRLSGGG